MSERVCGTDGRTYSSMCQLLKIKGSVQELNYRGACIKNCKENGIVCGINGITYKSECEAWSDYSITDYIGPCQEIGLLTDTLGPRCSTTIKCKRKLYDSCQPIYPPGACCPICAGAIRIIYSKKQIGRAMYALKQKNMDVITLKSILRSLESLIKIGQCRLAGYLTIETDLFVTIQSDNVNDIPPNRIQIEACAREIERISILISTQSHQITSDVALSSLTVANLVQISITNNSIQLNYCYRLQDYFILLIVNYIIYLYFLNC